ncbi:MAG: serine/threonine-protein kinase [candidate division Zixibacteria bacterium]|nr:serine/threonine-protein kinase [candidate division Zixibacteria bacterium]
MQDQFIGNYRILKKIGAGGMASVYLAVHRDVPNLKVVLKVLSDARLVERFRQEADKLALLDGNAHICQIKHFFNHGDEIVIAMEYIDGEALDQTIKDKGKLPVDEALDITSEVLNTLAFAHEKGVFHRDIKPSNIMVDRRGQVKIIDFGIAKSANDPTLTMAGSSCGTPSYMAPEQFNPTEQINYALVDVYAIGTTLFYLLTGKLPFTGDNPFALRDAKLFTEPVKPRDIDPSIPKPLEQIILKSIASDPEKRYGSVLEMKEAIGAFRGKAPAKDATLAGPAATTSGALRKKSKTAKIIGILAAIIVVAVGAYIAIFSGSGAVAPAVPQLQEPTPDAVLASGRLMFFWQGTAEGGNYRLELADNTEFTSPRTFSDLTVNRFAPTDSLANGRYFWRVEAVGKNGRASGFSPAVSFSIDAPAPVATTLQPDTTPPTTPQPTKADLIVSIQPRGDIYIDGRPSGIAQKEARFALDAGRHIIRVENAASSQKSLTDTVTLAAGARLDRTYRFTIPETAPAQASGRVSVGSKPQLNADIYIDGRLQTHQTPYTFTLSGGKHIIRAVMQIEGATREKTDSVIVVDGGNHKLMFDFEN